MSLTEAGRERLEHRLRSADGHDITDTGNFFIVLAFLSKLPSAADREAVLRRRLDFLEQPASFFYDGARPLTSSEIDDPYRKGIFVTARATSQAQRAWLREMLTPQEA